ncbi:unnamed protein product, partial [Darwinula stevensoni]
DFTVLQTGAYGTCVTFNCKGGKNVHGSQDSNSEGYGSKEPDFFKSMKPSEGLQLVLTTYAPNEVFLLSPADGFRLTVHPIESDPNPLGEGFDVNLQMVSNVVISKMQFERLHPEDGGNCALDTFLMQRFGTEVFNITQDTKYSKKEICEIQMLPGDARGCPTYPVQLVPMNATRNCNMNSYFKSYLQIHRKIIADDGFCGCPTQACTEESFRWSLSSAQMGREKSLFLDLISWMKSENIFAYWMLLDLLYWMTVVDFKRPENLAVVNVYYETMAVAKTVESALYPWTSFIGTLGGLLGLYTGISFLSVLEMLEWIFDLLLYGWRKPRHDRIGPKRLVIITMRERPEMEGKSGKKEAEKTVLTWEDPPIYNPPSFGETWKAALDLAHSRKLLKT